MRRLHCNMRWRKRTTLSIRFFILPLAVKWFYFSSLSNHWTPCGIVPGAMCSAGVVGANHYGNALLLLKLLLIFGFGLWLIINKLDLGFITFPIWNVNIFFLRSLYIGEFVLEILYFSNIPLTVPVFCCSVVFQAPKLPFGYTQTLLVLFFYTILVLYWCSITWNRQWQVYP